MPDESRTNDLQAAWKHQPEEDNPVNLHDFMNRRAQELHWSTRWEILTSIAAAAFFIVMAWRLGPIGHPLQPLGFAAALGWILTSLWRFRRQIRPEPPRPDAIAASGLDHYRRELEARRNHLRNAWIWHGPLILACVILALSFAGRRYPGTYRWPGLAAVAVILIAWTVIRVRARLRLARQIQSELDELDRSSAR